MRLDSEEKLNLARAVSQVDEANDAVRLAGLRCLAQSLRGMPFVIEVSIKIRKADPGEEVLPQPTAVIDSKRLSGKEGIRDQYMQFHSLGGLGSWDSVPGIAQTLSLPKSQVKQIFDELNLSLAPLGRAHVAAYLGKDDGHQSLMGWEKTWKRDSEEPSAAGIARSWGWDAVAARLEAQEIEAGMPIAPAMPARAKPKL